MESLQSILLIIHIIIAVLLVIVILLQPSSGDGGFVSSQSNPGALMSGRATANLLTRTTAILATIFILNSLLLAIIANQNASKDSQIDSFIKQEEQQNSVPLAE